MKMDDTKETKGKLNINPEGWRFKHQEGRRIKIDIKLNQDESIAFKNFAEAVMPKEADFDAFVKSIFFMGIETMNRRLIELVNKYAKEDKEKTDLGTSGSGESLGSLEVIK